MNSASVLSRSKTVYEIVLADLTRDAAAIVEVWSRNFPELTSDQHRKRLEWNYRLGPYGPGQCWLLIAGNAVVGTAGLGMRRLQVGDASHLAGLASDLAVDAQHRSLQPALMLQKTVLKAVGEADISLVYGLPNRKSMGVFQRLGYTRVATVKRFVKILRIEQYLERHNTLPALAQKLIAAPANLGMKMAWPQVWRKSHGWVIREMPAFDERFDDLAKRTQSAVEMTTARSARYLNWRYTKYPLRNYVTIGLLTPDESRLAGYATVFVSAQGQVTLADFWHETGAHESNDLMAGVIAWARRQQASSIAMETRGSENIDRLLRRFGFTARHETMELMAMQSERVYGALAKLLDRWYFVGGDEDYN